MSDGPAPGPADPAEPPRPQGAEGAEGPEPADIDTSTAHPARVRNFLAGGEDNFNADRKAAEFAAGEMPGGMELARLTVRSLGGFMVRAVQHLAGERGVVQFLHIGTPIPSAEDVHVVAQRVVPRSRIVYVGDDPVVLAHAHALRRSTRDGAAAYVHGNMGDVQRLLDRSAETLDFTQPIGVLLIGTLAFVPTESDPWAITAKLLDAMVPGSCLVVAHTSDLYSGIVEAGERLSKTLKAPFVVRTRAEILRFFEGLDLLDPGLVQIDEWQPPGAAPRPGPDAGGGSDEGSDGGQEWPVPLLAGVGRKP